MDGVIIFARLHQCAPPCNTCFLWPTRVYIPNGILVGSALFAQLTAASPYTLQWTVPFPLKIALLHEGSRRHLIHGSLGPPEFTTQMVSPSVQRFLQGSQMWQTDKQTNKTDRPHYPDCNNRLQCGLKTLAFKVTNYVMHQQQKHHN